MKRRVVWSVQARDNILEITAFIAAEHPAAARRVLGRISQQGQALGAFATGRPGRVAGTYEKIVTGAPYIIVYQIRGAKGTPETVAISSVFHTARNWPEEDDPAG